MFKIKFNEEIHTFTKIDIIRKSGIMTFYSNYNTFQFLDSSNNLESDKVMPFSQKKKKIRSCHSLKKRLKKKKKKSCQKPWSKLYFLTVILKQLLVNPTQNEWMDLGPIGFGYFGWITILIILFLYFFKNKDYLIKLLIFLIFFKVITNFLNSFYI